MSEAKKAAGAQSDLSAVYQALSRVQAIIEFELDGVVITANENFLRMFGYELDEIVGKHHRRTNFQAIQRDPISVGLGQVKEKASGQTSSMIGQLQIDNGLAGFLRVPLLL